MHTSILHTKASNFLLSMGTTGIVGETLLNTQLTGSPVGDLIIKVALPLISGILSPLVKEWIETRKHKRALKNRLKNQKL